MTATKITIKNTVVLSPTIHGGLLNFPCPGHVPGDLYPNLGGGGPGHHYSLQLPGHAQGQRGLRAAGLKLPTEEPL